MKKIMLFRKELILQTIAKVIQTSKKLVCKRTTSGNEPFTSQSRCDFRFLRIFEFIPLNRNQKIALSCIILLFAFYLAANMLYPWRGDDMGTIAALRIRSPWELIKTSYQTWTLRLGNIIGCFLQSFSENKIFFNIINSVIQIIVIWLLCCTAVDRRIKLSETDDLCLFLFAAGLSVFVCRACDTVYWVSGATLYSWSVPVYIGSFLYLRYCEKHDPPGIMPCILSVTCGILSGYTHENIALTGIIFLLFRSFFTHSRYHFCLLTGWVAGTLCQFLSPGVARRIACSSAETDSINLYSMFAKVPEIILFYAASSLIPLLVLFFLVLMFRKSLNRRICIRASVPLFLSILAAGVFAGCPLPPMRAYYPCSILVIISALCVFAEIQSEIKRKMICAAISVAAGFAVLLCSLPDFVKIHNDETERIKQVQKAAEQNTLHVKVAEHRVLRRSFFQYIFIEDFTDDPEFWLNRFAADYFKVQHISSIPRGETPGLFRDKVMRFLKLKQ